jgi:hypothetical protein
MSCLLGTCRRKGECQCVLVRWTDITSYDGSWMGLEEAKALKPAQMETLGWIIRSDETYIVLASTMDANEDVVGNVNAIPRAVISEIVTGCSEPCAAEFG